MRLVFGSAHSGRRRIVFAHVRAVLCISVTSGSTEVVDFGSQIDPDDSIGRAARLSLSFGREFVRSDWIFRNASGGAGGSRWRGSRSGRRSGCGWCWSWSSRSRCRSRCRSRLLGRGGSGLSGRGAATALSDVSLFGDAIGLICCLVGSPLFPAFPCSLLSPRHGPQGRRLRRRPFDPPFGRRCSHRRGGTSLRSESCVVRDRCRCDCWRAHCSRMRFCECNQPRYGRHQHRHFADVPGATPNAANMVRRVRSSNNVSVRRGHNHRRSRMRRRDRFSISSIRLCRLGSPLRL